MLAWYMQLVVGWPLLLIEVLLSLQFMMADAQSDQKKKLMCLYMAVIAPMHIVKRKVKYILYH